MNEPGHPGLYTQLPAKGSPGLMAMNEAFWLIKDEGLPHLKAP